MKTDKPNQPGGGFSVTETLPRRMTVAQLARWGGSRYVLSPRPRRGNRFAPDTAGLRLSQKAWLFRGALLNRDGRYVAPAGEFAYELVGPCTIVRYDDVVVGVYLDYRPRMFPLRSYFLLDAGLCEQVLGPSHIARRQAFAAHSWC